MKNFINQLDELKSASFVGIKGYESKTSGEVSNVVVCTNISVQNAKENDLKKLQNCTDADLQIVADKKNIDLDTVKQAYSELLASSIKNLNSDISERSNASQAQTDAYQFINGSLKIHLDTMTLHMFGLSISKTVLVEGVHKSVNSSNKTIAKNAITKHLNLTAGKFRTFHFGT